MYASNWCRLGDGRKVKTRTYSLLAQIGSFGDRKHVGPVIKVWIKSTLKVLCTQELLIQPPSSQDWKGCFKNFEPLVLSFPRSPPFTPFFFLPRLQGYSLLYFGIGITPPSSSTHHVNQYSPNQEGSQSDWAFAGNKRFRIPPRKILTFKTLRMIFNCVLWYSSFYNQMIGLFFDRWRFIASNSLRCTLSNSLTYSKYARALFTSFQVICSSPSNA